MRLTNLDLKFRVSLILNLAVSCLHDIVAVQVFIYFGRNLEMLILHGADVTESVIVILRDVGGDVGASILATMHRCSRVYDRGV